MLRTFRIKAELGIATDTGYRDGKIVEKSKQPFLNRAKFERALSALESVHRKKCFAAAKVPLNSDMAYELASRGPVRPAEATIPIIYSVRLVEFNLPHIELEIISINETESFFLETISQLGFKLRTTAVTNNIRCIRFGFFHLEHALLSKHLNLENVLNNIYSTSELIRANNDFVTLSANPIKPKDAPVEE